MWCEQQGADTKERMRDVITYFEGTCEFCLGNMGIDSYKEEVNNLIDNNEGLDEETVMLLYYAGSVIDYKVENFTDALEKWHKAEELAIKTGNDEYLAKVHSYLAIYYYVKKDFEKSREYFENARKIFRENRLYSELALHYINILWYKRYEENRTEVMEYLDRALHYVQLSDSKKDARVYLHLGYIYKTIFNDFISGFKHLTMAREMCYQNKNYEMECMTFHVLADGYIQLGHYEQAVKIYRDIFDTERYRDITPNLKCMVLGNLIPAYMKIGDLKSAETELERMFSYVPQTQVNLQEQFEAAAKWLKAKLLIASHENLDEAQKLLELCRSLYEKRGTTLFPIEDFDFQLAGSFGDLYSLKGDVEKSIEYYAEQHNLSEKYGKLARMQAVSNMSSVYEKLGNYQEALAYRKEKMELFEQIEHDKLLNQYDRLYKEFFKGIREEELQQLNATGSNLEHEAEVDGLTGVRNRRAFDEYLGKLKDSKLPATFGVIFSDIDFFKKYNDGFGHSRGDDCLKQVGKYLKEFAERAEGTVYRYGGEEFVTVLSDTTAEALGRGAKELVQGVERLKIVHPWSEIAPTVTMSAGFALMPPEGNISLKELTDRADKALYRAKAEGRNRAFAWQE